MQLGLAKLDVPDGPAAAAIGSAQEQAKALMVELRDLVHGISPRTLSELGLTAALDELAAANPVPTTVQAHVRAAAVAGGDRRVLRGLRSTDQCRQTQPRDPGDALGAFRVGQSGAGDQR